MGVTLQVRDLDRDVQQKLRDAAAREGLSLSAYLRRELTRLAARCDASTRVDERSRNRLGVSADFFSGISTEQIVDMIREDRDR